MSLPLFFRVCCQCRRRRGSETEPFPVASLAHHCRIMVAAESSEGHDQPVPRCSPHWHGREACAATTRQRCHVSSIAHLFVTGKHRRRTAALITLCRALRPERARNSHQGYSRSARPVTQCSNYGDDGCSREMASRRGLSHGFILKTAPGSLPESSVTDSCKKSPTLAGGASSTPYLSTQETRGPRGLSATPYPLSRRFRPVNRSS